MEPDAVKSSVKDTYTQIAEHFDLTRYKPWPETMWYASMLEPGSTVADLGCGNGRNALCLAEFGMRVVAIDFVGRMLDITMRKARRAGLDGAIRPLCCDVTDIPLPDASFDHALYVATMHHLPTSADRARSVRELWRTLKPGGTALVGVWAVEQERFAEDLKVAPPGLGCGDVLVPWTRQTDGMVFERYVHLFTMGELLSLFSEGWGILESFSRADNHYALLRRSAEEQ